MIQFSFAQYAANVIDCPAPSWKRGHHDVGPRRLTVWWCDSVRPSFVVVRFTAPEMSDEDGWMDGRHARALSTAAVPDGLSGGERPFVHVHKVPALFLNPGRRVVVVLGPDPSEYFHSVMASARHAQWLCARRTRLMCHMAYYQTIGGGWAAVMNVPKALECALRLNTIASELQDVPTTRRCRLFVGYAHLWNGNFAAARAIFEYELARSSDDGDRLRCRAALAQLSNPELTDRGDVSLGMTEVWNRMLQIDV